MSLRAVTVMRLSQGKVKVFCLLELMHGKLYLHLNCMG